MENLLEFIVESNEIERVYDDKSIEQSLKAWEYLAGVTTLTLHDVRVTHQILMDNPLSWSEPFLLEKYLGSFRDCPVYIGGHEALSPLLITGYMEQWLKLMNDDSSSSADLEEMTISLHVRYEAIHPFVDGNGRTGRMFMNWWRVKHNLPILVIKAAEKYKYYKWFR